jgi:hypothetical protein
MRSRFDRGDEALFPGEPLHLPRSERDQEQDADERCNSRPDQPLLS